MSLLQSRPHAIVYLVSAINTNANSTGGILFGIRSGPFSVVFEFVCLPWSVVCTAEWQALLTRRRFACQFACQFAVYRRICPGTIQVSMSWVNVPGRLVSSAYAPGRLVSRAYAPGRLVSRAYAPGRLVSKIQLPYQMSITATYSTLVRPTCEALTSPLPAVVS